MARPKALIPKYSLHKASGRARVVVAGRSIYLGKFNSAESREAYLRVVADIAAARSPEQRDSRFGSGATVAEVVLAWLEASRRKYGGRGEYAAYKPLLALLNDMFGTSVAAEFGAKDLRRIREVLVSRGRTRKSINRNLIRLRTLFKWSVGEELVPAAVLERLRAVPGLRRGEDGVAESEPRRPVDDATVDATLPYLPPSIRDLVQLLRLTGARPGELTAMRPVDVDVSGKVWWFTPESHKGSWRGKDRAIGIGPRGQEILAPYLAGRPLDARCFTPAESSHQRREARTAARRTPENAGNTVGSNRVKAPEKAPGDRWTTQALGKALRAGIRAANRAAAAEAAERNEPARAIHHWTLYELRHSAATAMRRTAGLEAAAAALGHSSGTITDAVYAERDRAKVEDVLLKIG